MSIEVAASYKFQATSSSKALTSLQLVAESMQPKSDGISVTD